jgi:hypothetical protein
LVFAVFKAALTMFAPMLLSLLRWKKMRCFSSRYFVIALFCWMLAAPVFTLAADVDFTGTVTASCALTVVTNGTLGLSTDGTTLGSELGTGLPGTATIMSIGAHTVSVSAPTRVSANPAGYNDSAEIVEVAYVGAGGLSAVVQGYTSSPTNFAVGSIPLSALTINNRIVNSNGFVAGTYTTRTVVTCS